MHYQIYIPGSGKSAKELMVDAGLDDLIDGFSPLPDQHGPDNEGGMIVGWPPPGARQQGYRPEQQTWLPAVIDGEFRPRRYWVGIEDEHPPLPGELARPRQHGRTDPKSGEQQGVVLGDGHAWNLPAATELPFKYTLDLQTGKPKPAVPAQFKQFWDDSYTWFLDLCLQQVRIEEGQRNIELDDEWWNYLVRCLRLNYRIVSEMADHLGLFTTDNVVECLAATCQGHNLVTLGSAEDERQSKGGT